MNNSFLFTVKNGLATFDSEIIIVKNLLEDRFLTWAAECNAEIMLFPPLIAVKDLNKLDYFRNFPHLALVSSHLQPERFAEDYAENKDFDAIPSSHLTSGEYALPSAACYNIYLYLEGTVLEVPKYITTVATCFRNEKAYEGLRRLRSFTMREIVCIGPLDSVQLHLNSFKQRILNFAVEIGLPLEVQIANDPFFRPQDPRAIAQILLPVKEEFVYGDSVAIASVNFHRNFFGERLHIQTADKKNAFSGCVAFGIERWLYALFNQLKGDTRAIKKLLEA